MNNFSFLADERVARRFADINLSLLEGRHIQPDDYYVHQLLSEYYEEFKFYYESLYRLYLKSAIKDGVTYYYLTFPEEGRRRMNTLYRFKALSEDQVVIGIILLNWYYERYFDDPKEITWDDIKDEIEQGEFRDDYQKLFFKEIRGDYTDQEWEAVERRFLRVVGDFDHLGWVKKISQSHEALRFQLKPSIHRLAELYNFELAHIDDFLDLSNKRREES